MCCVIADECLRQAARPAGILGETDQWSGLNLGPGKTINQTTWVLFLTWYTVFDAQCMGISRGGLLNCGMAVIPVGLSCRLWRLLLFPGGCLGEEGAECGESGQIKPHKAAFWFDENRLLYPWGSELGCGWSAKSVPAYFVTTGSQQASRRQNLKGPYLEPVKYGNATLRKGVEHSRAEGNPPPDTHVVFFHILFLRPASSS